MCYACEYGAMFLLCMRRHLKIPSVMNDATCTHKELLIEEICSNWNVQWYWNVPSNDHKWSGVWRGREMVPSQLIDSCGWSICGQCMAWVPQAVLKDQYREICWISQGIETNWQDIEQTDWWVCASMENVCIITICCLYLEKSNSCTAEVDIVILCVMNNVVCYN